MKELRGTGRAEDDARNAILLAIAADLEAGRTVDADAYLARFPAAGDIVADELGGLRPSAGEARSGGAAEQLGPFELLRELGRGGQGVVHLARDARLGREVALKVLPRLVLDPDSRKRFEREARVASQLDDPAICTVHESGEIDGTPYIAMRYVPGETLAGKIRRAREAEARGLEISAGTKADSRAGRMAVIGLVERVARALGRAHDAGIVHRDVKPGNVMVTPDGDPVLLDFGLAREDDSSLAGLTRTGDVFGTPAYMAPEQLLAGPVGPATDVHALGATLYECLTLERPFAGPTREALETAIVHDEPRDPVRLRPELAGDVRAVLLTALAKEPARRYRSAGDLADDLERLRTGRPVLARPPSPWHRAARFVARHRKLVATTGLVVVVLAGATVVSTLSLLDARAERETSEETVTAFEEILTAAAHDRSGRSVLLVDALDEARVNLEERLTRSPLSGARLIGSVGRVYTDLGVFAKAEPLLLHSLETLTEERGETHRDTLVARQRLGILYRETARFDGAEKELSRVYEARRRLLGADAPETLGAALDLGLLARYRGELDRADELFERVRAAAPADMALDAMAELAVLRDAQGRPAEALSMLEEVASRTEAAKGPSHTDTAAAWNNLAVQYQSLSRFDEAQELFEKTLAVYAERFGAESPRTHVTQTNLALLLKQRGEVEEAERLYRESLAVLGRVLDPDHPEVLNTRNNLARLLHATGRLAEAEDEMRGALESAVRRLGEDDAQTLMVQNNLGLLLQDRGDLEGAEIELGAALEGRERTLGPDHPDTLRSINNLGHLYMATGRDDDALAMFERSLELRTERLGRDHPDTITALVSLGWFHQRRRRAGEAEVLYEEALAICRDGGEALREVLPVPLRLLVGLRLEQRRIDDAEDLALELVELHPEGHPRHPEAQALLEQVRAAR